MITDKITELHQKLTDCLSPVKLGVAGRLIYYSTEYTRLEEKGLFILAVTATSPEQAEEAGNIALDAIRDTIFPELQAANIGFACRQMQKRNV